jgi:hypothetical protein
MRPIKKQQPPYLTDNSTDALSSESRAGRETIQNALIETLGNYCSYCEIPLGGYLIEHYRYLAAWQPEINISEWEDLLLICADCRSHIRKSVLTAEQAEAMLWPDRDVTFGTYAQSPLLYELREVKFINEDAEGKASKPENKQLVFVTANPKCDAETRQRAQNTIDHFQLNMPGEFYNVSANEFRLPYAYEQAKPDNRIFKRTEAWFEATRAVERLREADTFGSSAQIDLVKQLLRDQISTHAAYSGNWSVWVTVFSNSGITSTALGSLFTDQRRFPGTNETDNLFAAK